MFHIEPEYTHVTCIFVFLLPLYCILNYVPCNLYSLLCTQLCAAGYPWWPGMVDYCPELEETFLLDEESPSNEAAKYHVV